MLEAQEHLEAITVQNVGWMEDDARERTVRSLRVAAGYAVEDEPVWPSNVERIPADEVRRALGATD